VWTGEQALERGLVDMLGGIEVATNEAAELAELDEYSVIAYNTNKDFLTKYLEDKMDEMKVGVVKNLLGEKFDIFKKLYNSRPQEGIQAILPLELENM
jgi:protease-4